MRALFFAVYREALGTPGLAIDLPEGSSVRDLVAELRGRGRPFSLLPASVAVAVNHIVARADTSLADGDEVAFLPPVAGG